MTNRDNLTEEFVDLLIKSKEKLALYISIITSLAGTVIEQHGDSAEETKRNISNLLSEYTPEQLKEAEEIILNHIRFLDESKENTVKGVPKEEIQKKNYAALAILREIK